MFFGVKLLREPEQLMSEFGTSYHVETSWSEGLIQQDVIVDTNRIRERMWTNLVKLQEQGIREALIDLGWTPPPEREPATQKFACPICEREFITPIARSLHMDRGKCLPSGRRGCSDGK
jgi:hypothetical protein